VTELTKGHCFCRAITYEFDGPPKWVAHCHCESCRRATSSPMTTWLCVPRAALRFTKGEPRYYHSSPGVRRGFCGACGTPLSYENESRPSDIDLYAMTLDDPTHLRPVSHVFAAEQLPWLEILDELPRYATTNEGGKAQPMRIGPREK
jgi:hypothetical protein